MRTYAQWRGDLLSRLAASNGPVSPLGEFRQHLNDAREQRSATAYVAERKLPSPSHHIEDRRALESAPALAIE